MPQGMKSKDLVNYHRNALDSSTYGVRMTM